MAWGRSNEQWNHTASLMTLLASIHCDPDATQKPSLALYHPYMPLPETPTLPPDALASLLRSAGIGKKRGDA
jgi:hypothetical protein